MDVQRITITPAEQRELEQARPEVAIQTVPTDDPRYVTWLTPKGCPLLRRELDGTATCTVHDVRPYNCRRFLCLRDEDELYRPGGPLGCRNLSDRLERNVHALEFYRTHQRYAQREWADAHGWTR